MSQSQWVFHCPLPFASSSSSSTLFIQGLFWWSTDPWEHLSLLPPAASHIDRSGLSYTRLLWIIALLCLSLWLRRHLAMLQFARLQNPNRYSVQIWPQVGDDSKAVYRYSECEINAHHADLLQRACTDKYWENQAQFSSMRLKDIVKKWHIALPQPIFTDMITWPLNQIKLLYFPYFHSLIHLFLNSCSCSRSLVLKRQK